MGSDVLEVTVTVRADEVRRLAVVVEQFCHTRGVAPERSYKLALAIEELFTNVIAHGEAGADAQEAWLVLTREADAVVAVFEDRCRPFDPTTAPAPDRDGTLDERPVGGLGLHLIRALVDVAWLRVGDRNRTTLRLSTSG